MCFTWPDPISIVADIVTIVGMPVLAVSSWRLYREVKHARKPKGVSEDCISFFDLTEQCTVNIVPFERMAAIPRVGDRITLPGESGEDGNAGAGKYEVAGVDFYYRKASDVNRPAPAVPFAIQINVRKLASH
jgi:hypothetical protein